MVLGWLIQKACTFPSVFALTPPTMSQLIYNSSQQFPDLYFCLLPMNTVNSNILSIPTQISIPMVVSNMMVAKYHKQGSSSCLVDMRRDMATFRKWARSWDTICLRVSMNQIRQRRLGFSVLRLQKRTEKENIPKRTCMVTPNQPKSWHWGSDSDMVQCDSQQLLKYKRTVVMKMNLRLKGILEGSADKEKSRTARMYTARSKQNLFRQADGPLTPGHQRTRSFLSPKASSLHKNTERLKTESSHKDSTRKERQIQSSFKSKLVINVLQSQDQPRKKRVISKIPRQQNLIDQFNVLKIIGKGRFGRVVSAQHTPTGFVCALKEIDLSQMCEKLCERLIAQIKIQSHIQCQNCLPLYSYFVANQKLYLILELGDTSLYDFLKRKKFLPESLTALYIRQVINALLELHSKGVIHRDLKPQNIILCNGVLKLADFGWAAYSPLQKRLTYCGTLDYISPQVIAGQQYSHMVDIWSVGILCYQLTTGHPPFQSSLGRSDTERKIATCTLRFPNHLSPLLKDFVKKLLSKDPELRMGLQQALQHPWMVLYQNYQH